MFSPSVGIFFCDLQHLCSKKANQKVAILLQGVAKMKVAFPSLASPRKQLKLAKTIPRAPPRGSPIDLGKAIFW